MTDIEDDFVDRHIVMRERLEELLAEHVVLQYETDQVRKDSLLSEGALADIGYTERELERMLDHHRKESKRRQEAIGETLCDAIMVRFGSGEGELKCRGRIANAAPDVKQEPIVPSKGDEDYDAIMSSLGVPTELMRSGAIAIHFKHMGDHLTALSNAGQNPPGKLLKRAVKRVTYRSNTRKKKT